MLINSVTKFISHFILNKNKKDEFIQKNLLTYSSDDLMRELIKRNELINGKYDILDKKLEKLLEMANKKISESEISKQAFNKMADIFVRENLGNESEYEILKKIQLAFENHVFSAHSHFATCRFEQEAVQVKMNELEKRFSEKKLILTDMPEYFTGYEIINIHDINKRSNTGHAFIVAYNKDYEALLAINELEKNNEKYISLPQAAPMARYYHIDRDANQTLVEESHNNPRLHYCPVDFENIFQALLATKDLQGDYVEIGVFQGASARATLNYMGKKKINRICWFFDTFEGFSYNEALSSSDAYWQNTHQETSEQLVNDYLLDYKNVNIVKSNIITDKIPREIESIAVCNIDVDIYDAVYEALEKIKDLIVKHGIIIVEDYGHTPMLIGAQKAAKKFIDKYAHSFTPIYLPSGQLFLIKR